MLQLLLIGYRLAIEVVSLPPWNDLAARPDSFDLGFNVAIGALPLVGFAFLFASGVQSLATLAALGFGGYLAWQLWVWWKPFAIGADAGWRAYNAANFSDTLHVIPSFGSHLPPDAQHITLHLLALITVLTTATAVSHMRHL